jgi:EamA domain-containing membrane protein RarD
MLESWLLLVCCLIVLQQAQRQLVLQQAQRQLVLLLMLLRFVQAVQAPLVLSWAGHELSLAP